jgi:hypothetical protein
MPKKDISEAYNALKKPVKNKFNVAYVYTPYFKQQTKIATY